MTKSGRNKRAEKRADRKAREKKPFKDTGFVKIAKTIGRAIPEAFDVISAAKAGNFRKAIDELKDLSKLNQNKIDSDPETVEAQAQLFIESENLQIELAHCDRDFYAIEVDDRKNARSMGVKMMEYGKGWIVPVLALLIVCGAIAYNYAMFNNIFKIENETQALIFGELGGMMGSALFLVLSYYFGSRRK